MKTTRIVSHSPDETRACAASVLADVPERAVLALHGELGSGKTCFVQGLALALGVNRAIASPSFTIVNEYRGRRPLYHIDLYRIRNPQEALALGLDEYLHAEGFVVIEWAERAGDLLPDDAVHIHFERRLNADERTITLQLPH